jgi:ferrochelatase
MLGVMNARMNDGVLLVAHGTINDLQELPAFLTQIRQGRAPTDEMVEEMGRRYAAIGGSPLMRITRAQASALAEAIQMPVLIGMRFGVAPISEALLGAAALGLSRLVVLPLAPFSVELYANETEQTYSRLKSSGHSLGFELLHVAPWGSHAGLVQAQYDAIISHFAGHIPLDTRIVLTAHSLPKRVIDAGDGYAKQIEAAVAALEQTLGRRTVLAYQSQSNNSTEWLGPSLLETLEKLAKDGEKNVAVVPIGFISEHVETLYDLDHEASVHAARLGLEMSRIAALNAGAGLVGVLADLVKECIKRADTSAIDSSIQ